MSQTSFFGVDEAVSADALPSNSNGLSWYNVQRQRLRKFATQYLVTPPLAVETLRSQGETDTTIPDVLSTREGFTQLRRDLPVIDQYYEYSGDATYLDKVKELCLAWARVNLPDGKPINETNLEWLLRVINRRRADFSGAEWAILGDWLQNLRSAKESAAAGQFTDQMVEGEGVTLYGNWWTHHYKILLLALHAQGDEAAKAALLAEIDGFAAVNFPYGNGAVTYPTAHTVVGTSAGEQRFDIPGNHTATFVAGTAITVRGSYYGDNDGAYTVASSDYLTTSDKTRIVTAEAIARDGGGGSLSEAFDENRWDMPRAATSAGESIDYVRRDALHYQVYDIMPWIEISLLAGGRYDSVVANAWSFFQDKLLATTKHYEFADSSDPFDTERWDASHSEYLAPEAMFKPSRAVGMILSYLHYRRVVANESEDARLVALCQRSTDTIASYWPQHFRWALGYGKNV